VSLRT